MEIKIGQIVVLNDRTTKEKCFVEEVLTREVVPLGKEGQYQVSLYAFDGDYIGDYWTDELTIFDEIISDDKLIELIKTNIDKKGLVKDFAKVLTKILGS